MRKRETDRNDRIGQTAKIIQHTNVAHEGRIGGEQAGIAKPGFVDVHVHETGVAVGIHELVEENVDAIFREHEVSGTLSGLGAIVRSGGKVFQLYATLVAVDHRVVDRDRAIGMVHILYHELVEGAVARQRPEGDRQIGVFKNAIVVAVALHAEAGNAHILVDKIEVDEKGVVVLARGLHNRQFAELAGRREVGEGGADVVDGQFLPADQQRFDGAFQEGPAVHQAVVVVDFRVEGQRYAGGDLERQLQHGEGHVDRFAVDGEVDRAAGVDKAEAGAVDRSGQLAEVEGKRDVAQTQVVVVDGRVSGQHGVGHDPTAEGGRSAGIGKGVHRHGHRIFGQQQIAGKVAVDRTEGIAGGQSFELHAELAAIHENDRPVGEHADILRAGIEAGDVDRFRLVANGHFGKTIQSAETEFEQHFAIGQGRYIVGRRTGGRFHYFPVENEVTRIVVVGEVVDAQVRDIGVQAAGRNVGQRHDLGIPSHRETHFLQVGKIEGAKLQAKFIACLHLHQIGGQVHGRLGQGGGGQEEEEGASERPQKGVHGGHSNLVSIWDAKRTFSQVQKSTYIS